MFAVRGKRIPGLRSRGHISNQNKGEILVPNAEPRDRRTPTPARHVIALQPPSETKQREETREQRARAVETRPGQEVPPDWVSVSVLYLTRRILKINPSCKRVDGPMHLPIAA